MDLMRGNSEERLDALFQAFRNCPTPEPSVNFMPNLWAKIETRQSYSFSFGRIANAFVTAALALSVALGVYLTVARSGQGYYQQQTYVEAVESANPTDTADLVGPVRLDLTDPGR